MRQPRFRLAAALLVPLLALAACGGDGDDSVEAGDRPADADDQEQTVNPPAADSAAGEKPEVEIPSGPAPTELVIDDLVVGDGAEAVAGSTVEVHYVGVLFDGGSEFDASWNRGTPFSFTLGAGQVIQGWDDGVAGMKVGGRRQLVIPPDLGYGDAGAGGVIPPGATLVFVVDLLSVG